MSSVECLIRRLNALEQGELPKNLIEFLEKSDLISFIDLFVFEEACKIIKSWENTKLYNVKAATNFSRATIIKHQYSLADMLNAICNKYKVDKKSLVLEITETFDEAEARDNFYQLINNLNDNGFKVSIDDFGSGYANFQILREDFFKEIKFDISLVKSIDSNPKSLTILSKIIELCKELREMTLIMEGIENLQQLKLLEELKCDVGQGCLFDRPMPVEEFVKKYGK